MSSTRTYLLYSSSQPFYLTRYYRVWLYPFLLYTSSTLYQSSQSSLSSSLIGPSRGSLVAPSRYLYSSSRLIQNTRQIQQDVGRYRRYTYFLTSLAISFLLSLFSLRFLVNSKTRSPTLYLQLVKIIILFRLRLSSIFLVFYQRFTFKEYPFNPFRGG